MHHHTSLRMLLPMICSKVAALDPISFRVTFYRPSQISMKSVLATGTCYSRSDK